MRKAVGGGPALKPAKKTRTSAMPDEDFLEMVQAVPSRKHPDCHYIQTPANLCEPLFLRKCKDGWRAGLLEGEWPKDFRNPVSWDVWRKKTAQEAAMELLSRMADGARRDLERSETLINFVVAGHLDQCPFDWKLAPLPEQKSSRRGKKHEIQDESHILAAASLKVKIPKKPLPVKKMD